MSSARCYCGPTWPAFTQNPERYVEQMEEIQRRHRCDCVLPINPQAINVLNTNAVMQANLVLTSTVVAVPAVVAVVSVVVAAVPAPMSQAELRQRNRERTARDLRWKRRFSSVAKKSKALVSMSVTRAIY
jgi:hypothetical protein